MSLLSAIRVALAALLVNKARSALTSLGIVIGIAAVIALVAAGTGARHKLDERLDSIGKNLILVRPGAHTMQGTIGDFRPLTVDDANAIRKRAGHFLIGAAEAQVTFRVSASRFGNWPTTIVGSIPAMEQVRNWKVHYGRFYNDDDVKKVAKELPKTAESTPVAVEETFEHSEEVEEAGIAPLASRIAIPPTRAVQGGDRRSAAFRARMRGLGAGRGRGTGRGRGRGRGWGRGRGRGAATTATVPIAPGPSTPEYTASSLIASGPGLRSMDRPDYSVRKNFRELFYGKKDSPHEPENDVLAPPKSLHIFDSE
jgi:hypothetical protein